MKSPSEIIEIWRATRGLGGGWCDDQNVAPYTSSLDFSSIVAEFGEINISEILPGGVVPAFLT